jgi:enoyl-CoA hydratase/carnithine racemase
MQTGDILYEKKDRTGVITLNRPERLNALRNATLRELIHLLDYSRTDEDVGALIITGEGRAFCAGEDLKELDLSMSFRQSREHVILFQEITRQIVDHPKIIIAAVNGVAVGAGAEIAVACDIRLASETATLAFVEARRALFPTNGVLYLLPRLVGTGKALEMLVTGRMIGAKEALEAGLVNRVVGADELMSAAVELAGEIADNAPITVRLIKSALHRTYDLDLEAMMQLEVDGCVETQISDDMQEGVRAFLEKRLPRYSGK